MNKMKLIQTDLYAGLNKYDLPRLLNSLWSPRQFCSSYIVWLRRH